jgi:hypothetical protein
MREYYGYKVCYREKGKMCYVRHCVCNTYGLAEFTVKASMRYPPTEWKIIPLTKEEVIKIRKDCPFDFP